jgi:hypothetical protein
MGELVVMLYVLLSPLVKFEIYTSKFVMFGLVSIWVVISVSFSSRK